MKAYLPLPLSSEIELERGQKGQPRRRACIVGALALAVALVAGAVLFSRNGDSTTNGTRELVREFNLPCSAPKEDSQCARDIEYAMAHIKKHPDWYVGLHEHDDPDVFQDFLHKQLTSGGGRRCPRPCGKVHTHIEHLFGKCHDAEKGSSCYNHVTYTMKENLPKHPEWYPGLHVGDSFKVVQGYLHQQRVCPKPCGLKEELKKAKAKQEKHEAEHMIDGEPCHTAEAGEPCYNDVLYAKGVLENGTHDEWYDGKLNDKSNLLEIQAYLSKQNSEDKSRLCPKPCSASAMKNITKQGSSNKKCHTVSQGDECWKAVVWAVTDGIKNKPKWYKGDNISVASSFEHVQTRLSLKKNKDNACPNPACPCKSAEKGDSCYKAVSWVKDVGIGKHPKWYKGLTNTSSRYDIQLRLHSDQHSKCKLPCIFAPWWDKPTAASTF